MNRLAWMFWNEDECRPRALYRLLLQLLLLVFVLLMFASLGSLLPRTALIDWLGQIGILGVAILTVWVACRGVDLRPFADLGFRLDRAWWSDLIYGLILGALLITAVFFVAVMAGWVEVRAIPARSAAFQPFSLALFLLFVSYVAVGFGEEIFFRGYQLRNLAEGLNCRWISPRGALWLAVLISSSAFATLHWNHENTSILSWVNTLLGGVLLSVAVIYTGRLALAIGFHITWNFFQGGVFGFSVSGNEFLVALLTTEDQGPALWTGGAYGPEGGLLGTAAFVTGIVLILGWIRVRYGLLRMKRTLAEYPYSTNRAINVLS